MRFNSAIFDVLSEKKNENRPYLISNTPIVVVTTKNRNGSNRGIAKGSAFCNNNNTLSFTLACSQWQATIAYKLYFSVYIHKGAILFFLEKVKGLKSVIWLWNRSF